VEDEERGRIRWEAGGDDRNGREWVEENNIVINRLNSLS